MRSDRKKNRKRKHRLAKFFIKLLVLIVFLAGAMLGALTVLDYNPADSEMIIIAGTSSARPNPGDTIKLLSWNIGYGSLGDNASYFLDGGKDVFPSDEERVKQNLFDITI